MNERNESNDRSPGREEILVDNRQLTAGLELAVPHPTGPSSPGSLPARDPSS